MHQRPEITVIVPVYNVQNHVAAAISSLRAQTWTDFEAIVVDDGSTDESPFRLRQAIDDDDRFRIVQQANAGLSGARNTGLDLARGDFVAFLDSDDRYAPGFLSRLHDELVRSGADWAACAVRMVYPDGGSQVHSAIHGAADVVGHLEPKLWPLGDWRQVIRHFPSAWNKLYRRSLIEGLRYDEGTYFEDHAFFYRCAARTGALCHVPEPLYLQTQERPGQITREDSDRVFEQLPVLDTLQEVMQATAGKTGGDEAFERIAARLLFERSTALRDPDRRARFAAKAHSYMHSHNLHWNADWDAVISPMWELELSGQIPLSVLVWWRSGGVKALRASLEAVARQSQGGFETIVAVAGGGPREDAVALLEAAGIVQPRVVEGLQAAIAASRGVYVVTLEAGGVPIPDTLRRWADFMARGSADFGFSAYSDPEDEYHSGFLDLDRVRAHPPADRPWTLMPEEALEIETVPGMRIYRRAFLEVCDLTVFTGSLAEWPLVLGAALLAERAIWFHHPWLSIGSQAPKDRDVYTLAKDLTHSLQTLPAAARRRLPPGWQKRLLARAAAQARAGLEDDTVRQRLDSKLRLLALSSGVRHVAAEFDSGTPIEIRNSLTPPAALAVEPADLQPDNPSGPLSYLPGAPKKDRAMLTFQTSGPARFSFLARFDEDRFANLSFFDVAQKNILFHLSLRADDGVVAWNDRGPEGWGSEVQHAMPLDAADADVELLFVGGGIRVRVNGAVVLESADSNSRFTGLDQIVFLDHQGGLVRASFDLDTRFVDGTLDGVLSLTPRFEWRGALPRDSDPSTLQLLGPDGAKPLAAAQAEDGGWRWISVLPGRVWKDGADSVSVRLLDATGTVLAEDTLTREQAVSHARAVLALGGLAGDSFLASQVAEHLRFADALEQLSAEETHVLSRAADKLKFAEFLWEGQPTITRSPVTQDLADADLPVVDMDSVNAAIATVHAALLDGESTNAALARINVALPEAERVFLALVEPFCIRGEVGALIEWANLTGLSQFERTEDTWRNSAILPMVLHQGRLHEVQDILQSLVHASDGWLVTPAIGWVATEVARARALPAEQREAIVRAFAEFLIVHAGEYWDRTSCTALIRATVAMSVDRARLPSGVGDHLAKAALRAYALSPAFWREADAAGLAPTADLRAARAVFDQLEALISGRPDAPDKATLSNGLNWLARAGAAEAARVRREVFGPTGLPLPEGRAPSPEELVIGDTDALEAALRYCAFPDSPEPTHDLAQMCAEAMPWFYHMVPRAPMETLVTQTVRTAAGLIGDMRRGNMPDPAEIAGLESDLVPLRGKVGRHDGLAIALAVVAEAARCGHDATTSAFLAMLERLTPVAGDPELDAALAAPAVKSALAALSLHAPGTPAFERASALFGHKAGEPATAEDDLVAGSLLFDTVVTVFSCRAHLDSRIAPLRDAWVKDLERLDIPYVIVVGDGDGTLDGDVLSVNAPDDYEGLPQKTLATIAWVHEHTRFGHMLKVDDDCFLNVDAYFHGFSYRNADWYGRPLHRGQGEMDRVWHREKATTPRGRLQLDKSPEPSRYADGGSGYALSRRAMAAALRAARSVPGQALAQVSVMEDKLLGDLLSLEGITVEEEDYRIAIRRRMSADGLAVSRWVNGFDASQAAPVKLVHLDDAQAQLGAARRVSGRALSPRKIWASFQPLKLGYQSGTLELVSAPGGVERAQEAPVSVVACMRNEMFMAPHFLSHYRALGVENFLIADNLSDDGTLEYLADQPDVTLFSVDTDYRYSQYGVGWQQALMSNFRVNRWSLVADADELLTWQQPQRQNLPDLLQEPEFADAEAVRVFMLDMYPDGSLAGATFASGDPFAETGYVDRAPFLSTWPGRGPYSNAPTWTSALRHRLLPGSRPDLFVAQKLALLRYRPWMRFSAGLHFGAEMNVADRELIFGHFKYNADFHRKAQAEVRRRQHFNDAEEYRKYLALLSEGRDVISAPETSIRWESCDFVRDRVDFA